MRTLFLAWQAPDARQWFPIGRLDADTEPPHYVFRYTQGAEAAVIRCGFHPVASFPQLEGRYESDQLFPMFQNRVLVRSRKGFAEYLRSLALEQNDPIEILAITGGERQTDNFEMFPRIEKQADNSFTCRFFLHGWRHMPQAAQERAMRLMPGDELGVSVEMNNPATGIALLLTSRDYEFIGWTPRYLVTDLLKAVAQVPAISAHVVQVNAEGVPANRRVLIEFKGFLPEGFDPMTDEQFQPYAGSPPRH
jgi:hypothetical protein